MKPFSERRANVVPRSRGCPSACARFAGRARRRNLRASRGLGFAHCALGRAARRCDPVEIDIRGYRLCLRLEQIEGLDVDVDERT
jgi:hypothetical protein